MDLHFMITSESEKSPPTSSSYADPGSMIRWLSLWSWNDLRECQKLWGGLCILYCSYRGGLRPPYKYGTKYASLPRVFDTPSSHSNFNPNPNSNLNSKTKIKKKFLLFPGLFSGVADLGSAAWGTYNRFACQVEAATEHPYLSAIDIYTATRAKQFSKSCFWNCVARKTFSTESFLRCDRFQ